jgi:hypothetical protein
VQTNQTNDHEPSRLETTLTLGGSAIAIFTIIALGNLLPDLLLAFAR